MLRQPVATMRRPTSKRKSRGGKGEEGTGGGNEGQGGKGRKGKAENGRGRKGLPRFEKKNSGTVLTVATVISESPCVCANNFTCTCVIPT